MMAATLLKLLLGTTCAVVFGTETVTIAGDARAASQHARVPAVFNALTAWSPSVFDLSPLPNRSAGKERYPYLQYIQLFTATGGCYPGFPGCSLMNQPDLFSDPAVGMASGINITSLLRPLRAIVSAGFTPHVVTGNVPIALSASPKIGAFGFNNQPPTSMGVYRAYIAGVASALIAEFGHAEVASWRWGVFTEYNNADWLNASAASYFALFDHTVCGLVDALGSAEHVDIGVHGCLQCTTAPSWDPTLFLRHAATGVSTCSGSRVHLNWTGNSFYEHSPDHPGDLTTFVSEGLPLLELARELGLDTSRFGIDEGRLLWGPDGGYGNASLTTRAVGTGYQASWDALFFKLLATSGSPGAYYSRWAVNTAAADGMVPGATLFAPESDMVVNCAGHVAALAHKLTGGTMIPVINTSATPGGSNSIVDAVAALVPQTRNTTHGTTLYVLMFHHHPAFVTEGVVPAVTAILEICGLRGIGSSSGGSVTVQEATLTRVGTNAANFWPHWWDDQRRANLSHHAGDYVPGWSAYSDQPPLASPRAIQLFKDGLPRYRKAAALTAAPVRNAVIDGDGCLRLNTSLPPHEVALLELPL